MTEEIEQEKPDEEKDLTCPECGKGFQDMRGLTSHARHMHDISKEEILELMNKEKENNKIDLWKILSGTTAIVVALFTLGKR